MDSKFISQFKDARRAGAPLIAVSTADPAATISRISALYANDSQAEIPLIRWDCVTGFSGIKEGSNDAGRIAIVDACARESAEVDPGMVTNPVAALRIVQHLAERSVVFMLNMHRFMTEPEHIQAIWNLREPFKSNGRTLLMLMPAVHLPAELRQDVLPLDEPLPDLKQLETIVTDLYKSADLTQPNDTTVLSAVQAISGLAAFPAEQVTAMSLSRSGLNLDSMWSRKKAQIEQCPGLSVWEGSESMGDVKDCDNVIEFLKKYIHNVNAIVFIDEIEKAMAGASGDTSGVSQEMHGSLLSYMQDMKAKGMLFLGHPGTGKSFVAKAAGRLAGIPTIRFDFSAMKHSHVGESNVRLKAALDVVSAVSQGKALFIATTNNINILSPELRRRFKQGTFFFDLPSADGRKALWSLYTAKCGLPESTLGFNDHGWTGSEIETCCELARDMQISLAQAAKYIVPVFKSAPDSISQLRKQASSRFISAAKTGLFEYSDQPEAAPVGRKMQLT